MSHDLETAHEILDRQISDGATYYFEFVEHRLQDALHKVETAKKSFITTQDCHAIQTLVLELSNLNLGFERALKLTNKISTIREEIILLEELANDKE